MRKVEIDALVRAHRGRARPVAFFHVLRQPALEPDDHAFLVEHIDELGTPASNNHYNTGWAWAFDTPFPYWKRWAGAEGGVGEVDHADERGRAGEVVAVGWEHGVGGTLALSPAAR